MVIVPHCVIVLRSHKIYFRKKTREKEDGPWQQRTESTRRQNHRERAGTGYGASEHPKPKVSVSQRVTRSTVHKTDNQQGPTTSTGNCPQHSVITYKESEKEYITYVHTGVHICILESLLFTGSGHDIVNQLYFNQKWLTKTSKSKKNKRGHRPFHKHNWTFQDHSLRSHITQPGNLHMPGVRP